MVDLTTYHVDIDASMPALAEAKNRYVKAPFAAWAAIDIDRLYAHQGPAIRPRRRGRDQDDSAGIA